MSELSALTINGVEYIPHGTPSPVRIVILQRGWVMVGRWAQDGPNCVLTNASVIRRWGTTSGLGELASAGPTGNTELDPAGIVRFHELTMIASLDCDASRWPSC